MHCRAPPRDSRSFPERGEGHQMLCVRLDERIATVVSSCVSAGRCSPAARSLVDGRRRGWQERPVRTAPPNAPNEVRELRGDPTSESFSSATAFQRSLRQTISSVSLPKEAAFRFCRGNAPRGGAGFISFSPSFEPSDFCRPAASKWTDRRANSTSLATIKAGPFSPRPLEKFRRLRGRECL